MLIPVVIVLRGRAWETERNGGTMEAENDFATTLEREAFSSVTVVRQVSSSCNKILI